jgi:hypothetical protein
MLESYFSAAERGAGISINSAIAIKLTMALLIFLYDSMTIHVWIYKMQNYEKKIIDVLSCIQKQ